ncbi:MAG TPA: M36 family metallopeptidase [Aequorivita sp.]|nr:M36 family metallopeptidase [Aequorivita sp.]
MKKTTHHFFLFWILALSLTASAQDSFHEINRQLSHLVEQNHLMPKDLQWKLTSEHISSTSGVHHQYFRQTVNGIEIYGTESGIHFLQDGRVVSENNKFIKNASDKLSGSANPMLSAVQAVNAAALQLQYTISKPLEVLTQSRGVNNQTLISDGGISKRAIPAALMYAVTEEGKLVLTWDLSIQSISHTDWWSLRINANTGEIINKANWISNCNLDHNHTDKKARDFNANLFDIPNYEKMETGITTACNECYEVFALPVESPYYGNRSIEINPANPIASPYGWHDTNGATGAEYTVTRGNNVDAYILREGSFYQPDGGANLDFTGYPFSQIYTEANRYEDASITNVFYTSNVIHDIMYQFGFDEVSGNFQENNYGKGGLGNDYVIAEVQSDYMTCNASFGTPPDGQNPGMNMYICEDKDSAYDNLVILHEYGHGISFRLTGGAANSDCLWNHEQMGEGWSDFFGVLLTITAGDTGVKPRPIGTYLLGQGAGGYGIRDYPYSTDMKINPQTYDFIKTARIPHGVGSVWAQMLWEVTWGLIEEYGYDPNPYNFTGDVTMDKGNTQALAIVMEGLKLQPCSPGFIDGRDAILAADQAIYGGANECIIWKAFAKRGLGYSAYQGSSGSVGDGFQAFDTPFQEATLSTLQQICVSTDVISGLSGGKPVGGIYSGPGVTDDGNGLTFTFDPTTAGVGVQTITYETSSGPCAEGSSANDVIEVTAIPINPVTNGGVTFCPGDSVTVTASLNNPSNIIRWFDSPEGGDFLFEGTTYTFTPQENQTLYAQESAPGPISKLVISEISLDPPHQFEIQNIGPASDYSGYKIAISHLPYDKINSVAPIIKTLGNMDADSVLDFSDDRTTGNWGGTIFWSADKPGWIVIIDASGNVVDSVFWNFHENQISEFNITIDDFNITTDALDWMGMGAKFSESCGNDSFRRHGDLNLAVDWPGICETSDFGIPNADIKVDPVPCPSQRTATKVIANNDEPVIQCPGDRAISILPGKQYTIPDFRVETTVIDICDPEPVITQSPVAGTLVGIGNTTVSLKVANAEDCTFILSVDDNFYKNIFLYPNPTTGNVVLSNRTAEKLKNIVITDVRGRIINTIEFTNAGIDTNISLYGMANGMYFITVNLENTSLVKRIVKR